MEKEPKQHKNTRYPGINSKLHKVHKQEIFGAG